MLRSDKLRVLLPILYILLAYLCYKFFKPIAFLLASGIILSVLYFVAAYSGLPPTNTIGKQYSNRFKLYGASIITFLFVLSIIVLKDYEKPTGDKPYFTNTEHHVIQNTGAAFDKSITIFSEKFQESGLWSSVSGNLLVDVSSNQPTLLGKRFYQPIFLLDKDEKKHQLVNSVWNKPITKGHTISNQQTSLKWEQFEHLGDGLYKMQILFMTADTVLLGSTVKNKKFKFTFNIQTSIKKGISLLNILRGLERASKKNQQDDDASSESSSFFINGIVYQWLEQIGDIDIVRLDSDNPSLVLQPSHQLIQEGYFCYVGGNRLPTTVNFAKAIGWKQKFYVGLGRQRSTLYLGRTSDDDQFDKMKINKQSILYFGSHNLIPFYNLPGNDLARGKTVLRFIRNNNNGNDITGLDEGFLFQPSMKSNPDTDVEGMLKFQADLSGIPLKWSASLEREQSGPGFFSLVSSSGKVSWIYRVRDLSDNWFSFDVVVWYLLALAIVMLVIVLFYPSTSSLHIELPLLVLVYCFIVFRYLLLWRIATFPPLENIKEFEFEQTIRQFDNIKKGFPSSLTFLIVFSLLSILIVYRYYERKNTNIVNLISLKFNNLFSFSQLSKFIGRFKYQQALLYSVYLFLCFILSQLPISLLERIAKVVLPLFGYFYFTNKALCNEIKIGYTKTLFLHKKRYSKLIEGTISLFSTFLQTEHAFISLLGLIFFAAVDTGFSIIFLIFLIIRFIIFSLIKRSNKANRAMGFIPSQSVIILVSSIILLLVLLFWKGAVHFLLRNDILILIFLCIISIIFIALINSINNKYKRIIIALPALVIILCLIPLSSKKIHGLIDDKIRLVKYRAELIYKPLEEVLFENESQSNKEAKILETAQNQWFIHSYLKDAKFLDFSRVSNLIDFKPHFKTGVDYSTQTRDLVLPRYVIGEFGGFTMLLLLCFCSLPLFMYLLAYRLTNQQKTIVFSETLVALMALLFLFSTALMLWLTSTNRFVFFGQDFPFLSLTSRISVLLPMSLITIVLLVKPQRLSKYEVNNQRNFLLIGLFLSFVVLSGVLSGKSNEITADYFKVDYSKVESNINNRVNDLMLEVQEKLGVVIDTDEEHDPETWTPKIRKVVDALWNNSKFQELRKDSFSVYERSIWDRLRNDVTLGLRLNSPVHLRVRDNKLESQFNKYWGMELPPYDSRKVWKGDIVQQNDIYETSQNLVLYSAPGIKLLRVPSSFVSGNENLALLEITGRSTAAFLYDRVNKSLDRIDAGTYTKKIDSTHTVLFAINNKITPLNVNGKERKYFAKNLLLNGKQQLMYPLGTSLFWARHWAITVKDIVEKNEETENYSKSFSITLDYDLSKEVGKYLENDFPTIQKKNSSVIKDAAFSVIAADGNGKIRLMSDYAQQRKIIDPNNEIALQEELRNSYFLVDISKERIQWGNLNFLHMNQGPGSSFKPLLAAAITSQANAGWERISLLQKPENKLINFEEGIKYYAGEKLVPKWKGLSVDNKETDFTRYLMKSNNIYHSLLVFLGSYTKNSLTLRGGSIVDILRKRNLNSDTSFPLVGFDGNIYELGNKVMWPTANNGLSYFDHPNSMLSMGVKQSLGLDTETQNGFFKRDKKYSVSKLNDASTWGTPEYSYMLVNNRTEYYDFRSSFNKAIRQTSLGSGGVFDVTPLAMVEMYGRIATMNSGFKLTIDETRNETKFWTPSSDWKGNYSNFHYGTIFNALNKVYTDPNGTAHSLTSSFKSKYYIYAKTGTIGSAGGIKNSKRLALIISREKLEPNKPTPKIFLVFFRFDNARIDKTLIEGGNVDRWIFDIYGSILNKIIESKSFKNYMEE
jgi:hypothetical protein